MECAVFKTNQLWSVFFFRIVVEDGLKSGHWGAGLQLAFVGKISEKLDVKMDAFGHNPIACFGVGSSFEAVSIKHAHRKANKCARLPSSKMGRTHSQSPSPSRPNKRWMPCCVGLGDKRSQQARPWDFWRLQVGIWKWGLVFGVLDREFDSQRHRIERFFLRNFKKSARKNEVSVDETRNLKA